MNLRNEYPAWFYIGYRSVTIFWKVICHNGIHPRTPRGFAGRFGRDLRACFEGEYRKPRTPGFIAY